MTLGILLLLVNLIDGIAAWNWLEMKCGRKWPKKRGHNEECTKLTARSNFPDSTSNFSYVITFFASLFVSATNSQLQIEVLFPCSRVWHA